MQAILAIDSYSHVIGSHSSPNGLPWGHIKEDMAFFREKTLGNTVLMGYNTYKTLPENGLKGRENIVLAREVEDSKGNVKFIDSLGMLDKRDNSIYCIGGLATLLKCYQYIDKMYVTWISKENGGFEGDITFPVRLLYGKNERKLGSVCTKTSDGVPVTLKFVEYSMKGCKQ